MPRLRPLPVRWRLAVTSAALTLFILIAFAIVVGRLATDRLRDDFSTETRSSAQTLAAESRITFTAAGGLVVQHPVLSDLILPNEAVVRIVSRDGEVIAQTPNAPDWGPPQPGLRTYSEFQVATELVRDNEVGPPAFVQYARDDEALDVTVQRLWLFLGFGVLGGTVLATLAGLAIAGRAMRPIASLTSTAREIATTGDPSQRMPEPQTDDEIAELARTLEEMLRTLDASRAATHQAMQQQREFIADASHELRTPLTSVLANLELLQSSLAEAGTGEEGEVVDSALRSSRRMSRLVSDLLLLARADSGRVSERRTCDLAAIVRDALSEIAPIAEGHSITVHSPERVSIRGNPDELHRMVLNLVENPIRHTSPGTSVDVSLKEEGDMAVLEVADDGPGIPPDQRSRVFSRFVRGAGPADTAGGGGSGLGLAITRAVAESHGGRVELLEAPHGGALFRVELPIDAGQPAGKAEQASAARLGAL